MHREGSRIKNIFMRAKITGLSRLAFIDNLKITPVSAVIISSDYSIRSPFFDGVFFFKQFGISVRIRFGIHAKFNFFF